MAIRPGVNGISLVLFALRQDHKLFFAAYDGRLGRWGNWVFVANNVAEDGRNRSFRQIAVTWQVTGPGPSIVSDIYGVTEDDRLLVLNWSAGRWQTMHSVPTTIVVASTESLDLSGYAAAGSWWYGPFGLPAAQPAFPAQWTLTAPYGPVIPVASGRDDMWALSAAGANVDTRIKRAQRNSDGTWGAFTSYTTGTDHTVYAEAPWFIVDGRQFRNRRGEIFVIGGSYHLHNYIP